MCATVGPEVSRPRWGALYGATVPPLAALGVLEAAGPPSVVGTALRLMLALAAFAGMAMWVRANRAAFDLADWCGCAGRTMTVRIIESRRPVASPLPTVPSVLIPPTVPEEYEPAAR